MSYIFENFTGTLVNFVAVLVAGLLGALIKKSVPERVNRAIMNAMSICVIYIGISGMLEQIPGKEGGFLSPELFKILVMIISLALGTLIGEALDLDKLINKLGDIMGRRMGKRGKDGSFGRGFVNCSLLFCVGAMAVNGAIADAQGEPQILLAKSVIDSIACFIMATSLGVGCAFSAFFVLIYQGSVTLLAELMLAAIPTPTVAYMSVTGSLIIILVGTNVLGITKVKTANMVPGMFVVPFTVWLLNIFVGG